MPAAMVASEQARLVNALGEEGSGRYRRWVDVVDGNAGVGTKTVTVSVEYGTGKLGIQKVELFTIIFVGD